MSLVLILNLDKENNLINIDKSTENILNSIKNNINSLEIPVVGTLENSKYLCLYNKLFLVYNTKISKRKTYRNIDIPHNFYLKKSAVLSENKQLHIYLKSKLISHDLIYRDLVEKVLFNGNRRINRTAEKTISAFGEHLTFNVKKSLPLLTMRFISFNNILEELLMFLKGITDTKSLSTKIWSKNTTREFLDNRGLTHYREGDMGAMYGFQWRYWGTKYEGCDKEYKNEGIDQLNNVINLLKNDPFSRRIIMSSYNPSQLNEGCLEPCHGLIIQFYVKQNNRGIKYLSCHIYQRSADIALGVPYNIVSYSILLYIIAKKVFMKPNKIHFSFGDSHIYMNNIKPLEETIDNIPNASPKLLLSDDIINKDWEDIYRSDFKLIGYFPKKKINFIMAV